MAATYSSRPPGAGLPQFAGAPPLAPSAVPSGTLAPGTVVRVGEHSVKVERFLSEGGFAHVYLATSDSPIPARAAGATTKHVLKRMAVPNKEGVAEVGKEVQVMKLLRSHPKIVNFIDASVSEMKGPDGSSNGYEIYILMEWCAGGGIIDMMNTRLQNRLTETEILKIFSDTVEAVAHMHYQNPPLIHRDLKVENILLAPPQTFKLCDFGSTITPLKHVPTAAAELQAIEADINKTTTLQYRAPELVDVWSRKGYDEKIDIWALGVFLYKLCYYTTPFEEHGPLAILNAQYKIPPYPAYSSAIKGLIAGMLQERAPARPNIYQVHEQVCRLRGTSVKLENIYASSAIPSASTLSASHDKTQATPYTSILSSAPTLPSNPTQHLASTVSPMRRGRPAKGVEAASSIAVPAASDNRMVRTGVNPGSEWQVSSSPVPNGLPPTVSSPAWKSGGSTSAPISAVPSGFASSAGFSDSFSASPSSTAQFPESFRDTTSPDAGITVGPSASGELAPVDLSPTAASALFSDLEAPRPTAAQVSATSPSEPVPPLPRRPLNRQSVVIPDAFAKTLTGGSHPSYVSHGIQTSGGAFMPAKPDLVSRSSQTSPKLLASWKLPGVGEASVTGGRSASALSQSNVPVAQARSGPGDDSMRGGEQEYSGFPGSKVAKFVPKSSFDPRLPSSAPASPIVSSPSPPSSSVRPPYVDLLGDDDGFGPSNPSLSAVAKSKGFSAPSEQPSGSGTDFGTSAPVSSMQPSREKFRPTKPAGELSPAAHRTTQAVDEDVEDRFPALEDFDAPPLSRQAATSEGWTTLVEKDDNDSSDDGFPESVRPKADAVSRPVPPSQTRPLPPPPAPKPAVVGSTRPLKPVDNASPYLAPPPPTSRLISDISEGAPTSASSSSSEQGDINLGPALASIRKFAPQGNDNAAPIAVDAAPVVASSPASPDLIAPKPQTAKRQAAISSLVSRYEQISAAIPPGELPADSPTSPRPPPPPPAASKPANLRRSSTSQSQNRQPGEHRHSISSHGPIPKASADGVQNRFPDSSNLERHFASAASLSSPPPTLLSSTASRTAPEADAPPASPQRLPGMTSNRAPPFKPVPPPKTAAEGDEEEERFAGVSNMRSRWEQMGRSGGGGSNGTSGQSKSAAGRKEWAAV